MHTILIAGVEDKTRLHEMASMSLDLKLILPESFAEFRGVVQQNVDFLVVSAVYYERYQVELDLLLEDRKNIKIFILSKTLGPMDVKLKDVLLKQYFPLKLGNLDTDSLRWILQVVEEMEYGYHSDDLTLDYKERKIDLQGKTIPLTPLEFDLFLFLRLHETITLTRDELIKAVWGYNFLGDSRTIDTHIKSLRRKLGKHRRLIKTIWGKGYQLEMNGTSSSSPS